MAKKTTGAAKQAPKKTTASSIAKKTTAKKTVRKPNAAFMAALTPSPALGAIIGTTPSPRTEMIKKIWDYIRKNGLQDKTNKRMINADTKLKAIFEGKDQVSMFDLAKIVSNHVKK